MAMKINLKSKMNRALMVKQVGAERIKSKDQEYFKLGNGLFTEDEIVKARLRNAKVLGR